MFKTIDVLLIQSKFSGKDVIVMGICRSPKVTGKNYCVTLEKQSHDVPTGTVYDIYQGFESQQA